MNAPRPPEPRPSDPRPPDPRGPEPSDEVLGALLRAAMGDVAAGSPPSGDEAETAARLAAGEAADDPALRAVLAEVADALATVAAEPTSVLSSDVRAAAIAAWEAAHEIASSSPSPVGRTEGPHVRPAVSTRALGATRPVDAGLLRWAAALLVALGVGLFVVLSSPQEAVAGLRISAFLRLDLESGRHETTSGGRFDRGERLVAAPREMLGFCLPDGGAVVLSEGGAVRVASTGAEGTGLTVEAGTVRVAVGRHPMRLTLDGGVRLTLEEGRAWISGRAVAVSATGRARLERADLAPRALEGPVRGSLSDAGLQVEGRPSADLFRMPSVLGVAHVGRAPGRLVAARRWRVLGGDARRTGTSLAVGPGPARLAWRLPPGVRRAHTLRLLVEGPEGLRVFVPGLDLETVLGPAPASGIPGRRRVDLPLPAGWYEHFEPIGEEFVLVFEGSGRFAGASFLSDGEGVAPAASDRADDVDR